MTKTTKVHTQTQRKLMSIIVETDKLWPTEVTEVSIIAKRLNYMLSKLLNHPSPALLVDAKYSELAGRTLYLCPMSLLPNEQIETDSVMRLANLCGKIQCFRMYVISCYAIFCKCPTKMLWLNTCVKGRLELFQKFIRFDKVTFYGRSGQTLKQTKVFV